MADTISSEQRSRNMSRIRSRDTKPEMLVRSFLHASGFRFRLHVKDLPGKPDIVLPKYKTVIFVHGCFWHQHHCKDGHLPKSRCEYWGPKLSRNRERDRLHKRRLHALGWRTFTIWECETADSERLAVRLHTFLTSPIAVRIGN